MALKTFVGWMMWPSPWSVLRTTSFSSQLLDAADEKAAVVFRVGKSGTISKIGFRTGTVTTGATLDVRLETVDASGNPSGTLAGATTNGSQIVASTDDNVFFKVTMTANYTATGGEVLAIVVVNPAVSPGNLNIVRIGNSFFGGAGFPYANHFTASWSRNTGPIGYIEYSDGSLEVIGVLPPATIPSTAFNSASNPDERGNIFQLPASVSVIGMWAVLDGAAGANWDAVLYDSNGTTVLASVSQDGDYTGDNTTYVVYLLRFTSAVTLLRNTNYRMVIKPTTTTSIEIADATFGAAADLDMLDGGQNVHQTTRVDAGAWTETTTSRVMGLGLLISGADDGVGMVSVHNVVMGVPLAAVGY